MKLGGRFIESCSCTLEEVLCNVSQDKPSERGGNRLALHNPTSFVSVIVKCMMKHCTKNGNQISENLSFNACKGLSKLIEMVEAGEIVINASDKLN